MKYASTAALLALIAGCAQLDWIRPDTDAAARDADLARCEEHARASTSRMSAAEYSPMPSMNVGPGGGASMQMPLPHGLGDPARVSDELDSCMRAKGYRLVPAESAGAR